MSAPHVHARKRGREEGFTDAERLGTGLEERVGGLLRGLGLAGGLGDFLGRGLSKTVHGKVSQVNKEQREKNIAYLYIVETTTKGTKGSRSLRFGSTEELY